MSMRSSEPVLGTKGCHGALRLRQLLPAIVVLALLLAHAGAASALEIWVISQRARAGAGVEDFSTTHFGPVNEHGSRAFLSTQARGEEFDVLQSGVRTQITTFSGSVTAYTGYGSGTETLQLADRLFVDIVEDFLIPRSYIHQAEQEFTWDVDVSWDRPNDIQRMVTLDWIAKSFVVDLGSFGDLLVELDARTYQCPTGCGGGIGQTYYYTWTPVPEPATAVMIGAGLALLAVRKRA